MNWYDIPVKRPVATTMLFCAILLLGILGWQQIPVELLPANLEGDNLSVTFSRPNSEPEVIEREILIPLEGKASELQGLKESWGEINGSGGSFDVNFEPGTDIKIRQLELQRIANELKKNQPRGTSITVTAQNSAMVNRFVMTIQVLGRAENDALRSFVDERIKSRIAGVPGVGTVMVAGGAPEEITVMVNSDKCANLGISPQSVTETLRRSVDRLRFLGVLENNSMRNPVMLDGRPKGIQELSELRISPDKPVLIQHVAEVTKGTAKKDMLFRINGKPSVGLWVLKEEGANLVKLGRELRSRIEELRLEFKPYGIDFTIETDAAEIVEKQIDRLKKLALSGFIIALTVLFLFIRRAGAVAVVAVAVPVSLLAAMAMLYTSGFTLNIITLIGLAVGIGMLVDNSIVVYESVQRKLERGVDPDTASGEGVRITVRAILAATVTTAIVFLPVLFLIEDSMIRGFLKVLAAAILLPLVSSLFVAIGLVPLLSRKLAAPSAVAALEVVKKRRKLYAGLPLPDKWRDLFSGLLKNSLRNPASWIAVITGAVLITVIVAMPWVVGNSLNQEGDADEVSLSIDVPSGDSLESISRNMSALEQVTLQIDGVESVESMIQEKNSSLTIKFVDRDKRPEGLTADRVRTKIIEAARAFKGYDIRSENSSGGSSGRQGGGIVALLGQGGSEIVLSGPDTKQLMALAESIKERLESVSEIGRRVWISAKPGQDEIHVIPDYLMLSSLGLTSNQVFSMLRLSLSREGTEMSAGMIVNDGKEIPLIVRSTETESSRLTQKMEKLKMYTSAGVIPLGLVADIHKMPPPPVIRHHNGRRELSVFYTFSNDAPETGPAREALDAEINSMIRSIHLPSGYIVDPADDEAATSWWKRILIPILLLLFAVLAITFESLTMPVLVLLAVPLIILGSIWAMVLAGMPMGMMAGAGAVVVLGLSVNPAILLVDRMQQKVMGGSWSAGAAAIAAVRERSRPVLMTTCTTIAGLWPLAISTGMENEYWPPFAVVVMGGACYFKSTDIACDSNGVCFSESS